MLSTPVTHASALYFNPQNEITVEEGESVVVEAYLDTEDKAVNAMDITMKFPPELFEVLDVSRGDSVIKLWISDPAINNAAGTVQLVGGIPGGGSFASGLLVRVTLLAKRTGKGEFGWNDNNQILLNDGMGTQDAVEILRTKATVTPALTDVPKISSSSHKNQSAWYQDTTLTVSWTLTDGAVYSYALDQDAHGMPDEKEDTPEGELRFDGSIRYSGLTEGVFYFHLREGQKKNGRLKWSRARTFRVQIDATPPETLSAEIGKDDSVHDGEFFVSFVGTDVLSGIDHYEVAEPPSFAWEKNVYAPYKLKNAKYREPVKVRAVDKAGNMNELAIAFPAETGKAVWPYGLAATAVLAVLGTIWKFRRKRGRSDGVTG